MMRRAQPWLGTLVDITTESQAASEAVTAAFAAIARVHRLMSFHDPDSDVARFNRAAVGQCVEVDPHTWTVLQLAAQVADASDDCFNLACAAPLVEWGYLPAAPASTPPPPFVPGVRAFELDDIGRVRKTANAWIDLGGIAKGYAVDLAIGSLQSHGVDSACVNAGGDLRVFGASAWPVSVRAADQPGAIGAQLMLRNAAVATSAQYFAARRTPAGSMVSALIDGRSGQPVLARRSVSVRAASCAVADALTKVVMASGNAAHPCLEKFGAAAFII